jgi:31-O-methyltransferase
MWVPPAKHMHSIELTAAHRAWCVSPAQARLLWPQVKGYFRHDLCLQAGDTVIDVGANIGLFSLLASQWGALPLRIVAVEPVPSVHAALQANMAQLGEQAQALCCALGNKPGYMSLHHYPRANMLSTLYPEGLTGQAGRKQIQASLAQLPPRWAWLARLPSKMQAVLIGLGLRWLLRPQQMNCPVRTLSEVIQSLGLSRIALLKIDTERAEWDVLQGLSLEDWPRIAQITMEIHDSEGRLEHIQQLLRERGLSLQRLEQEPKMRAFGVWQLWAQRPT